MHSTTKLFWIMMPNIFTQIFGYLIISHHAKAELLKLLYILTQNTHVSPASNLASTKALSMWVPAELELGSFEKDEWTSLQSSPDGPDLHWSVDPEPRWIQALVGRTIDQPGGRFLFLFLFSLLWLWGRSGELSVFRRHHCRYFNLKEAEFHQATFSITLCGRDTNSKKKKMYPSLPQGRWCPEVEHCDLLASEGTCSSCFVFN